LVLPDGRVRLVRLPARGGAVVLDWTAGQEPVERSRVPAGAPTWILDADAHRLLLALPGHRKALHDVESGAIRIFEAADRGTVGWGALLSGGRAAWSGGIAVKIGTLDPAVPIVTVPLPANARLATLRQTTPDELALGLWSVLLRERRTLFVDPVTGAVRRELPGLLPAGRSGRLFLDEEGSLVEVLPSGVRRPLLGAPEGR
jgi:hypothetical protein